MSRGHGAIERQVLAEYPKLFAGLVPICGVKPIEEMRARKVSAEMPYVIYGSEPTEAQKRSVRRAVKSLRDKGDLPPRPASNRSKIENPAAGFVRRAVAEHRGMSSRELAWKITDMAEAGHKDALTTVEFYGGGEKQGTYLGGEPRTFWTYGKLNHVIAGLQGSMGRTWHPPLPNPWQSGRISNAEVESERRDRTHLR